MWKVSRSFWRRKTENEEYGDEQYKNFPEDEKQRLVEYRKKCYKTMKSKTASQIKTDSFFLANNHEEDFFRRI